jgi:hypothetical protein
MMMFDISVMPFFGYTKTCCDEINQVYKKYILSTKGFFALLNQF